MATLKGPLNSLGASGTLAGFFTLEKRGNRNYGYHKKRAAGFRPVILAGFGRMPFGRSYYGYLGKVSAFPFSEEQGARAQIFRAGWPVYNSLTTMQKEVLSIQARALHITGANLFMREWLQAHAV